MLPTAAAPPRGGGGMAGRGGRGRRGLGGGGDASQVAHYGIRIAALVNKLFHWGTTIAQRIVIPIWTGYESRVYLLYFAQLCSCDLALLTIVKILEGYFDNTNFLLLLCIGSVAPFLKTVHNLWKFIPCPRVASLISNFVLVFAFIVLLTLGVGTYSNPWTVFIYLMMFWPWIVIVSMISRVFIDRKRARNPFSAIREYPILGLTGALSQGLALYAAKGLAVSDCIALCFLEPLLAAFMASAILGPQRRWLHARRFKLYLLILVLVSAYSSGAMDSVEVLKFKIFPTSKHVFFILARAIAVARSTFIKWQYADFHLAAPPLQPAETESLFKTYQEPKKHRFARFPAPVLLVLDAIWDSGLRDSDLHGLGPVGTEDLYTLTDFTYLLPVSATLSFLYEGDTLKYGVLPRSKLESTGKTAMSMFTEDLEEKDVRVQLISESSRHVWVVWVLVIVFCVARLLSSWAGSRSLFDRGSSPHTWKYLPLILAAPFFCIDVLYLNNNISKAQIVAVVLCAACVAHYRVGLWNEFKRKYLLLCTQQLHFHQPSALRRLQRNTLLEFLSETSTEDYFVVLLETAIRHGNNMREVSRDTQIAVWDPAPTATAAWKLAFSLLTKSMKRKKATLIKQKQDEEGKLVFIEGLVLDTVVNAVDLSDNHSAHEEPVGFLTNKISKVRAISRMRQAAVRRKNILQRRRRGLPPIKDRDSTTACREADASSVSVVGTIRGALRTLDGEPCSPGGKITFAGSEVASTAGAARRPSDSSLLLSPRSEVGTVTTEGAPSDGDDSDKEDVARGVWSMDLCGIVPESGVVLAFGDARCGQLGVDPAELARRPTKTAVQVIEELRGCKPVQIEAAGVASFVVGAQGHAWAFGSNRACELGSRKGVTQVNTPQRMKSLKGNCIVQLVSSSSASGQVHTLALTGKGEVYTFGTSLCGALGQGDEVQHTASPLLLELSTEVPIRLVAAGARHSLFLTDRGQLYSVGDNSHGQLGTELLDRKERPLKLALKPVLVGGELASQAVSLVAVGDDHSLACTAEGEVFAWGANADGQLGVNRLDSQPLPRMVRGLHATMPTSIACGARHSLVVASEGSQVFAFGSNVHGQLGVGPNSSTHGHQRAMPTLCRALSGQRDMEVVQVVAASSHSLALTRVGEVFAFGSNLWGQLGFLPEGSVSSSAVQAHSSGSASRRRALEADVPRALASGVAQLWLPTRVVSLSKYHVRAISTAETHSLALAS